VSNQRFTVEFDRRVVGIAVRVPGGFMFFASDEAFDALDGRLFPRARAIARQLEKTAALPRSGGLRPFAQPAQAMAREARL
jgi:hypothetical protein